MCQSNKGSSITTGGGFSSRYAQPSWQTTAVKKYFVGLWGTFMTPTSGFDKTKRGYPDVSALAKGYHVVADSKLYSGIFPCFLCTSGTYYKIFILDFKSVCALVEDAKILLT